MLSVGKHVEKGNAHPWIIGVHIYVSTLEKGLALCSKVKHVQILRHFSLG